MFHDELPSGAERIPPRRSVFITVLAWTMIVLAAAMTPISALALMMVLAKSHGTASTTLTGFFSVVILPPLTVLAGIGLLRRRAWARYYLIALLAWLIAVNAWALMTRRPTTTTYTSPSGVPTTVTASPPNYHSWPIIAVSAVLVWRLFSRSVRREFSPHAIAKGLQDSASRVSTASPLQPARPPMAIPPPPSPAPSSAQQFAVLWLCVVVLAGTFGGMGWLVASGLRTGTTVFVTPRPFHKRTVTRQQEPASFFFAIGMYAAIGLGAAGLAGWMLLAAYRPPPPQHR